MRTIEFIKFLASESFGHCVIINGIAYLYEAREERENDVFYQFLNTQTLKTKVFKMSNYKLMKSEVLVMF